MNTDKLGFMASLGFAVMAPEEALRILSKIGYKAVGWTLAHLDPREQSVEEIKQISGLTRRYNMEISEVVVQQNLVVLDNDVRKNTIDFVLQCIQTFSEIGVKNINLFTGPCPWAPDTPKIGEDITEGRAWDMIYEAFDIFVPQAENFKMNLAVEGVWGMLCHDYYSTRDLIEHYDSSYLGVTFDPSHDVLAGNLDVGWIVKKWGKRIKHVHLKDAVGIQELGKFIFPLLGEGNVEWKSFFTALEDIGYDGYMTVEFESFKYYEQILHGDIRKAAVISLDNIKKLIGEK